MFRGLLVSGECCPKFETLLLLLGLVVVTSFLLLEFGVLALGLISLESINKGTVYGDSLFFMSSPYF